MDSLWDRVKKNLGEWYVTAYDKTDELARIGKMKIEVAGMNREIQKQLSELGGRVYDLIAVQDHKGNKTTDDTQVRELVAKIGELEDELKQKEEKIESIRKEKKPGPERDSEGGE